MKFYITFVLLFLTQNIFSQNLQVHYDMGENRKYVTTTLEMFKTDKLGSTFWFVDMDYDNEGNKSMSLGYWEIARYFTLPVGNKKLSATIQYNDGAALWGPLHNAWMVGFMYPVNLGITVINTEILYRNMYTSDAPDYQLTFVWFNSFYNDKIHFTGYMDIWSQDINGIKKNVLQAEPQVWYNLNSTIAIGSEVEISKNFLPTDKVEFMPTLAIKWTF